MGSDTGAGYRGRTRGSDIGCPLARYAKEGNNGKRIAFATISIVTLLMMMRITPPVLFAATPPGGAISADSRDQSAGPAASALNGSTPPISPLIAFQKRALLELVECLPELGLRIHDDRPIPRHRFLKRLS